MPTGATGQLGLALPVQGELSGTWGNTVNNGITQYTNIAIAATLTLTNDGAVTLANTTGDASASNITSTLTGAGTVTAQFAIVRVTGTLTTAKVVTAPSYSKTYVVVNAATGGIVTFKASGQTGVSIAVGESAWVYFNGTDYVKLAGTVNTGVTSFQTSLSGLTPSTSTTGAVTLAGTLGTSSGGTNLTSFTSGGVVYASSSSALATGSALTFDGSAFTVGSKTTLKSDSPFLTGANLTSGANSLAIGGEAGNSVVAFFVNNTEGMRLNTTGLGIGTSSPSQILDVQSIVTRAKFTSTTGTNVVYGQFVNTGGSVYVGRESSTGATFGAPAYASVLWSEGAYPLVFATNNATKMTLDSAGNLGLGVTPSAWAALKAVQIGSGSFAATLSGQNTVLTGNAIYDGAWKYVYNGFAGYYQLNSGNHQWFNGASGTAGNAITFTQAMTLNASGNLAVGNTAPQARIHAGTATTDVAVPSGTFAIVRGGDYGSASTGGIQLSGGYGDSGRIGAFNIKAVGSGGAGVFVNDLLFTTTASYTGTETERARIDSSGNVLVGGTAARSSTVGTAHLDLFNGTAPAGTLTNGVSLYSSSGDLKFMNAAGDAFDVGYRNIPQNAQTGNYTLTLADSGDHIYHAVGAGAATYTIPANGSVAFPIGTAVTFINMSTTSISIAITTDTMYLSSAGTTGTRTLAQYGSATAIKLTSTTWLISGSGLT
jgi:hypothetical protein